MQVKWGLDLQSEHERYMTEIAFGGCPVIIRDYPKEIKAFYMRQNDDWKTVVAMDFWFPGLRTLLDCFWNWRPVQILSCDILAFRIEGLKFCLKSALQILRLKWKTSVTIFDRDSSLMQDGGNFKKTRVNC